MTSILVVVTMITFCIAVMITFSVTSLMKSIFFELKVRVSVRISEN